MPEADEGKKSHGARILKWIGVTTAVISLVLGSRQIIIMVREHIEQKGKAAELSAESQQLLSAGEYGRAWETISEAAAIRSEYRERQVAVAMQWLRDVRISPNRGEQTFTAVAERLLPVLYRAIDTSRRGHSATVLAHIGWANYLMFKEGDRSVKVDEHFTDALRLDTTNLYANAMLGFWILYPGHGRGSIQEANRHFAAALRGGGDTNYVRHLAMAAYRNASSPECKAQIISLADQMRKNGGTIGLAEREGIVGEAYFLYRREIMDEVGKLLPEKDHLDTFMYLTAGIDMEKKPYLKEALIKLKGSTARNLENK